jgi:uncharacterized protein (TIGR03545 family)
MSTAGSTRSVDQAKYTPGGIGDPEKREKRRTRLFRWQGIIPIVVILLLSVAGWFLFGERIVRSTLNEAGTKALGTEFTIAELRIRELTPAIELAGIALADPFDRNKNLFEIGRIVMELEPRPLLEKKIVVKRLSIADVRTGTTRSTPARPVSSGGFAPRALAETQRFTQQFRVPLLALVPLDSLKALVLDPAQLKAVQAALSLAREADSAKLSLERQYAELRVQETLDSSAALVARLQGANVRTLGIEGARRAVADVRRATARVDSAKARVEGLVGTARRSVDTLQAGLRGIDAARREDYEHARGLLKLPSFDAPDIGSALFGKVTIDKFQQAVYWTALARQYAPPGLLPRESSGPQRMRASGRTVHFSTPASYPRFLLRRADVNVTMAGAGGVTYAMAASDVTTDPAIVGKPTLFAIRRSATGSNVDSLRILGSMDHTTNQAREVFSAHAAGVKLPSVPVPSLPYSMDPGRGTAELRFRLDGQQLSGSWAIRSTKVSWKPDSARLRKLNTMEALVARVLTGIDQLELTAEMGGTLTAPRMAIRSNLDRQVGERLRAVAGQEIAAAQARVRSQVDRIVDEKTAPVRAKIDDLRAESERRVADARARLDAEKRKLDERLRAVSAGAVGLPRLPGL